MVHIDYYLSTLSPFVYLAGTRPAEIAARYGASLTYRPVDTTALFARTGGLPLAQRHESRRAYRLQELRRQAARAGQKLNPQPMFWPVNAAPSAYAIIAAQAAGGDVGALVQGFGRAVWAENRDISDDEVISDVLAAAGFERKLALSGMLAGAETYARNLEDAVSAGVFGVPFFIVDDGEMFWGQDRLDDLDAHLAAGA